MDKTRKKNKVVVAFGDSTTEPRKPFLEKTYADHLQDEFPKYSIVNAGVGGNTTAMAKDRFETDVLAHDPYLVIIQFGINDSAIDVWQSPPAKKPRVSRKEYEKNLKEFIGRLKRNGTKVILMTPNPLRWTPELKKLYGKPPYKVGEPDGFNGELSKYAETVRHISKVEKAPLIDVYAEFEAYGKQKNRLVDNLLLDGMHPNDKGHKVVAALLIKQIYRTEATI